MSGFIEGETRSQATLFPEILDEEKRGRIYFCMLASR